MATLAGEGDRRVEELLDALEREVPEAFLAVVPFDPDRATRFAFGFDFDIVVPDLF